MGKIAAVAGASGLVGSALLKKLLEEPSYEKVLSLVRKKSDFHHPKLLELVVDFDALPVDLAFTDFFCTLGTTIKKAGSEAAFSKVDFQYPLDLAKIAKSNGAKYFSVVTAMGSNVKSLFFYNRVKGQLEESLKELNISSLCILRPSMLLGDRKEERFFESLAQKIMTFAAVILPPNVKAIEADKVAEAMIQNARNPKSGVSILNSGEIQKY